MAAADEDHEVHGHAESGSGNFVKRCSTDIDFFTVNLCHQDTKEMKKSEFIIAWFVAICLGAVMHMAHDWAELSRGVYYILPVNECVWEHMKMIFYPMLLFAIYLCIRKGN